MVNLYTHSLRHCYTYIHTTLNFVLSMIHLASDIDIVVIGIDIAAQPHTDFEPAESLYRIAVVESNTAD